MILNLRLPKDKDRDEFNKELDRFTLKHPATARVIVLLVGCLGWLLSIPDLDRILWGQKNTTRRANIYYDMVIALTDQQLATAIALLGAAIKKFHIDKDISVYHFNVFVASALFNSICFVCAAFSHNVMTKWGDAQQITLSLLRIRAEPDLGKRRLTPKLPWIMRIILMLTLNGLLVYSGSVSQRTKQFPGDCPALCFQNEPDMKLPITTIYHGSNEPIWWL